MQKNILVMEKEIWKDIQGFEGLYQVSNTGKVKSLERTRLGKNGCFIKVKDRILKQRKCKGYFKVTLCKGNITKGFQVQRLVAKAFIDNPNNFPCVNHKDENKENNCVENLEWCDYKYNANYGTAIKRSAEKRKNLSTISKKVICLETNTIYPSISEAERLTGIANTHISSCCLNKPKYKTAGGFHWRFYD